MNIQDNKTFCILPWVHLNTWPNGNVFQCCLTDFRNHCGSTTENTLEEIWNNTYMKELRVAMLNGNPHESCNRCYTMEQNGVQSSRQSSNNSFSHHIDSAVTETHSDGYNPNFKLAYWDFRFSNICNFKCRMCGSSLSSSWYDDHNALYNTQSTEPRVINIDDYSKKSFKEYISEFISTVEEIYFAGGEPLLMDEHYFILDELIKAKKTKVRLRYNTNLSKLTYKHYNVLDYWNHFGHKVSIFASIDAVGKVGEYIRSGSKWSIVEQNIKTILAVNPQILHISVTVQVFNIFEIPQLVDTLISLGVLSHNILLNNILGHPERYNIRSLPVNLKEHAAQKLLDHCNCMQDSFQQHLRHQYMGIIKFMNDELPADYTADLKYITSTLDDIRSENCESIISPELLEWYSNIK